jgi:hypothetical protein
MWEAMLTRFENMVSMPGWRQYTQDLTERNIVIRAFPA